MNTNYTLAYCFVSLAILAYMYFAFVVRERRDRFRADIRAIRDDLFDFMWRHGYDYDLPAYRDARQTLNGLIRISNMLSLLCLFVAACCGHWKKAVQKEHAFPDERLRDKVQSVHAHAIAVVLHYLFLTGLTGIVVRAVSIVFRSVNLLMKAKQRAGQTIEGVLEYAYRVGGNRPLAGGRASGVFQLK